MRAIPPILGAVFILLNLSFFRESKVVHHPACLGSIRSVFGTFHFFPQHLLLFTKQSHLLCPSQVFDAICLPQECDKPPPVKTRSSPYHLSHPISSVTSTLSLPEEPTTLNKIPLRLPLLYSRVNVPPGDLSHQRLFFLRFIFLLLQL